jgi:hypothetical protein
MEFEVTEITESVGEDANRAADVAAGAVLEAADAAVHPISTLKKQARRLEKKGRPITRAAERDVEKAAEQAVEMTYDVVSGALPERVALAGIRVLRGQARRQDMLGAVAYQTLKLMNTGFERALRTLNKFENASEPPAREPRRRSTSSSRSTRRSTSRRTAAARTTTRRTATRARRTARRTTRRATTAARRSA